MKASIVINTLRDNQAHLVESVDACLTQEDVEVQVIVSTVAGDPAVETLKNKNVELYINDRPGIYYQLNNALGQVKHDWWSYISGNDVMLHHKMRQEISLCLDNQKHICYSAYKVMDHELNFIRTNRFHPYSFDKHLAGNFVTDGATVSKTVLKQYGPLSEEFDNLGYWDFWLRIGKEHPEYFIYNDTPVFNYRLSNQSRHVKRKKDKAWKAKEMDDRRKMLSQHGPLKGKYVR